MDNTLIADAVSAAEIAVLVLDAADRVRESNPAATRLLGHLPEDLIGMHVSAFLPLALATAPWSSSPTQTPHQGAVEYITGRNKANQPISLAVTIARWTDSAGCVYSAVIMRDAATEREIDQIRQKGLIRSDNAIRGANIGVFEYDLATDAISVSDIWRQLLELAPGEDLDVQLEWRSRVHPDDLAGALEPIRLCGEGQAERASCEYRLQSRDRSHWQWMRTDLAVARRDPMGKPSLLVGAQTNITERKAMEDALRISAEQFRSAFENAPVGMAIVGLDGAWLKVNPALCNLLGFAEEELFRTDFQTLTHPADLDMDLGHLKLLTSGEVPSYTIEKRYYRANGSILWGKQRVGMVRNVDGKPDHFVSQVIDVTEQRRIEQMKNEFVSTVSHELRTPLTSILGALSLLEADDDAPYSDEVHRLLFIAKTNGDRLHHLINDILDFQKFSAQQVRFSLSPHLVAGLVEETLLANLASADKYGVRYATVFPDRSLIGLVDPKRFDQVMANLLSNATKFADPSSVIEVSAQLQGPSIRISVSNTGPGIPETFKKQVFKPFSQVASMSGLRSGGTGLGLSIAKQIVEQMGGDIGFESVPEVQTTFWFTIRTAEAAQ